MKIVRRRGNMKAKMTVENFGVVNVKPYIVVTSPG